MTVKELMDHLRSLPDDLVVVMSIDEEGNRFKEIDGVDSDSTVFDGENIYYSDEQSPDEALACVVLWPIG